MRAYHEAGREAGFPPQVLRVAVFKDLCLAATREQALALRDVVLHAFYDEHMYASVEGGVYPVSNDQNCADGGCEVGGYPMPFISVSWRSTNHTQYLSVSWIARASSALAAVLTW